MKDKKGREPLEEQERFDDALKKLLSSPPAPKITATKKVAKAKKKAR